MLYNKLRSEVMYSKDNPESIKTMFDNIADSYDMDIEPDDIEVSDTVTILWEIG